MKMTSRQWVLVDCDDDIVVDVFEDPEAAKEVKESFESAGLSTYKVVLAEITWSN